MRPFLRITTVNLAATVLTCSFLAVSIGYFLILEPLNALEQNVLQVQSRYINQQKQLIQDNVNHVVQQIAYRRQDQLELVRSELLEKLSMAQNISGVLDNLDLSRQDHLQQLICAISELPWLYGNGSFHLFDQQNRLVHDHCLEPQSSDPSVVTSVATHHSGLLEVVERSRHSEQLQWHEYRVPKSDHNETRMLSLGVLLPHLDAVLVVTSDLTAATRQLQRQLLNELAQERFGEGNYGYYYVIGPDNLMVMNAFYQPAYHDDLSALNLPPENVNLSQRLKRISRRFGADFYSYDYHNPSRDGLLDEKLAYVAYDAPWDWTIGTGFYLQEHKQRIAAEISDANRLSQEKIERGLWLLAVNLLFGLIVALYVNRHIHRLERNRLAHMHELEQYKKLLDLSCMVSKGDLTGHITYTNESFQNVTGYSAQEMLGKPHNLFRHPSTPKKVFKEMWDTIQAGKVWRGSSKNLGKNGKYFYTQQVIMPITDNHGRILEYIAARYDITELLEKREQLQLAFSTDTLTALGSRFKLMNDIERASEPQCLALIDMDSFHGANKQYGTEVGDQLLKHIGEALSLYFGGTPALLYRLNADIFGVMMPESEALAAQIKTFFTTFSNKKFQLHEEPFSEIPISLTAGIACKQPNLLTCADIALKEAKRQAKQVMLYDHKLANSDEYKNKMYWIDTVQQALIEGRLVAYYQPIVDLASGQVVKFETLMRLLDHDGKPVAPGLFLPILKQTHHYVYMTHAMIEQACAFFRDRRCQFSINFTVDDLLRKETVRLIVDTAQRYDVIEQLVLEIVETENIQNYDQALETISYLKKLGCRISIDDFGSGYSNFSYLTRVQADVIKIDGSLVQAINKDERTRELISSIVQFAHSSDMKVVAEFVDSDEIVQSVSAIGCDYAQGYYYGPPKSADEIADCPNRPE